MQLTLAAIASVYKYAPPFAFEILLVDNDSKDGIAEILQERYPAVRHYNMGYNAGFARANNLGIRHSEGKVLLFLNTDCLLENDVLEKACHTLCKLPKAAAVGVQLLDEHHQPQQSANYFVRGGLNFLLAIPVWGRSLQRLAKKFTSIQTHPQEIDKATDRIEVDWLSGAFMMIKRTAIKKAGEMDEDFFLYAEEIEWFDRLGHVGKIYFLPQLTCVHLENGSMGQTGQGERGYSEYNSAKGKQLMLSNLLSVRKRMGVGWFLFHWANLWIGFFISLGATDTAGFRKNFLSIHQEFPALLRGTHKLYRVG